MTQKSDIRVGIVTCGIRKDLLDFPHDVYVDKERRGAAFGKNELIRKWMREGAKYMFIFDDDCNPVIDGWQEKIIGWAVRNDVHYLAGLDYKNIQLLDAFGDTVISSSPCIGAFFFLDRECVDKVGLYNEKYIRYGWEDVGYSIRAQRAGMTGAKGWYSPVWINMYIHSMDMFGENPTPNMTYEEKQKYIKLNEDEFRKEIGR